MTTHTLLIANRGEIAIRIAHTAAEIGIKTVAIYPEDDAASLHVAKADAAIQIPGTGASAYLDAAAIVAAAQTAGATILHPGYGFLSENAPFAQLCEASGLIFAGPTPELLRICGDKTAARSIANANNIPILAGTQSATTMEQAATFLEQTGQPMMIKAVSGGGGRGMRRVEHINDLAQSWSLSSAEAEQAFGDPSLYVESYVGAARHIEVQIIGDGRGRVIALGERDCSIQRQHQKIIEFAPAPNMSAELRLKLVNAAIKLGEALHFGSIGTVEFLVADVDLGPDAPFYFIEINPRLQVEHTVTEIVTDIDLVKFQLQHALGVTLEEAGFPQGYKHKTHGMAVQLRINTESWDVNAQRAFPAVGQLDGYQMPSGRGIRVDGYGYRGYQNSLRYDSLLAKLICHVPHENLVALQRKALRTLRECQIDGIESNMTLLRALVQLPEFASGRLHVQVIEQITAEHLENTTGQRDLFIRQSKLAKPNVPAQSQAAIQPDWEIPFGGSAIDTPMPGTVVSIHVMPGDFVAPGQTVAIIEAMKMEAVITAQKAGLVDKILIGTGDVLSQGQTVITLAPADEEIIIYEQDQQIDPNYIRPDLAELLDRKEMVADRSRPEAVGKRHARGGRTARENVADLCDPNTFVEYGSLLVAAQRTRRTIEDLRANTPADGLVAGYGQMNAALFGEEAAQCMVMAYDYTVLAGTQGVFNHKKMDRLLHLAQEWQRPVILYAEGGGGRPGDVDYAPISVATLEVMTFYLFAKLSGKVPVVCIVNGYCFAGNAALAGCADVIIATQSASIGMGGPAMIEGGGLGRFHPREVGPVSFQASNGVIDILVEDEAEATQVAKKYLSYFQGSTSSWAAADQRSLRHIIPENRRRIYDIRSAIEALADTGSVLELRPEFGLGMITALIRIEGQPMGVIANNPIHLGGAIDADAADKASRFMQLCNAHGLPILSLVDTPGFMVGPEAEKTAVVRHDARMFVTGANLDVPLFVIVLRKAYGLGAMAMCGGSFHVPVFSVAWPTGEFGAMGLEGAVRLGFRKELEQAGSLEEQQAMFEEMVAKAYEHGKGLNAASVMEIDDVIDPADSRRWILSGLRSTHGRKGNGENKRFVDAW